MISRKEKECPQCGSGDRPIKGRCPHCGSARGPRSDREVLYHKSKRRPRPELSYVWGSVRNDVEEPQPTAQKDFVKSIIAVGLIIVVVGLLLSFDSPNPLMTFAVVLGIGVPVDLLVSLFVLMILEVTRM